MPIIRLDDEGNDIEALMAQAEEASKRLELIQREQKRKANAKRAATISAFGFLGALATFFLYSEDLATFISIWFVGVLAGLNLIDD